MRDLTLRQVTTKMQLPQTMWHVNCPMSDRSDEDTDSDDDVPLAQTRKKQSKEIKGTQVGVNQVTWSTRPKCKEFRGVSAKERTSDFDGDTDQRSQWTN